MKYGLYIPSSWRWWQLLAGALVSLVCAALAFGVGGLAIQRDGAPAPEWSKLDAGEVARSIEALDAGHPQEVSP